MREEAHNYAYGGEEAILESTMVFRQFTDGIPGEIIQIGKI